MTKHPATNKRNFNSFFFIICLWSSRCGTYNGLHNLDIPTETHKIDNVTYWFSIIVPWICFCYSTAYLSYYYWKFNGSIIIQNIFVQAYTNSWHVYISSQTSCIFHLTHTLCILNSVSIFFNTSGTEGNDFWCSPQFRCSNCYHVSFIITQLSVPFTVGQEVRSQRFEGPPQQQAQFLDSLTTVITSVL